LKPGAIFTFADLRPLEEWVKIEEDLNSSSMVNLFILKLNTDFF